MQTVARVSYRFNGKRAQVPLQVPCQVRFFAVAALRLCLITVASGIVTGNIIVRKQRKRQP